jgi:hypothetical protein
MTVPFDHAQTEAVIRVNEQYPVGEPAMVGCGVVAGLGIAPCWRPPRPMAPAARSDCRSAADGKTSYCPTTQDALARRILCLCCVTT